MELNNIIFSALLILFGFFFNKYILIIFKKTNFNLLSDDQFQKPQAFHEQSTYRLGGVIIFSLLLFVFLYLYFVKKVFIFEYLSFCTFFFFLGLVDDLKFNIPPKFRLIIMCAFLIILVISNNFYIERTGLEFLDNLLVIDIFSLIFVSLCFLFIINGSNLIDGFNGLLGIHSLIIFIILFTINFTNGNQDLAYILFFISLLNIMFLRFNFPSQV